jgi:hypothetical protein
MREQLQADMAILQARQQLAHSSFERTKIELQIIDLDKQIQDAAIDEEVNRAKKDAAAGRITQAALKEVETQAAILKQKNDEVARLKADAAIDEHLQQQKRDRDRLIQVDFELQQDALRAQEQLATTAKERRDIELRLLDLSYRQEKAKLEAVLADEQASEAEKEEARRRLASLGANYAVNRQGVINSTRGPLDEYLASLPDSAAKMNEALQKVAVDGFGSLEQAILDTVEGTKTLTDAFHEMAAAILADLLKLAVEKYVIGAISSLFGAPGVSPSGGISVNGGTSAYFASNPFGGIRASGGPVSAGTAYLVGEKRPELFVPNVNGIIIPRVDMGSRAVVASGDAQGMPPSVHITTHIDATGADPAALARVRMELQRMQSELPGKIVGTMKEAQDRFIWRR